MKGSASVMISINLIPEETCRTQARRARIRAWTLALVMAVGFLGIPLGMDWFQRARVDELHAERQRLKAQLQKLRAERSTVSDQAVRLQSQLERARALRSKREWSALFSLVAASLPPDAWLTTISTDPPVPARGPSRSARGKSEGATPVGQGGAQMVTIDAPRKLQLTGFAAEYGQLYEFIGGLKQSGAFAEVVQVRAGIQPVLTDSAVAFEVLCTW